MTSLFVFDLFGTLVEDTYGFPTNETIVAVFMEELGLSEERAGQLVGQVLECMMAVLNGPPMQTTVGLQQELSVGGIEVALDQCDVILWQLLGDGAERHQMVVGAGELLEAIEAEGHVARVLSNCLLPGTRVSGILDRLGLGQLIEFGIYSSDGHPAKPSPKAFAAVSRGSFSNHWMVGDSLEHDIEPARSLGWETYLVGDQLPAFDELWRLQEARGEH
jgi:FMN phosphatase YigB (HAD superfamily)